jgi:hypothetical protein
VAYEILEIEKALQAEREQENKVSWATLIRTKANRRRTLIAFVLGFFSQWNGIGYAPQKSSIIPLSIHAN